MSFLVIGECVADIVRAPHRADVAHAGGSPANVAYGLARLGHPTTLLTQLGDDELGVLLRKHLDSAGVSVLSSGPPGMRTPSAVVTLDDEGKASYAFDIEWTLPAQTLPTQTLPVQTPPTAGHIHIGSIAAVAAPGADATLALAQSLSGQATVSYDPNVRPALMGERATAVERVERCVAVADVVKASDEDISWLFPGGSDDGLDGTAARWLASGPSVVIVTRGEAGAVAYTHDHVVSTAARATTVVDTVGAGDSFMAATLHALAGLSRADLAALTPDRLRGLLDHGTTAAALTVSRAGANPPDLAELAAALADVRGR